MSFSGVPGSSSLGLNQGGGNPLIDYMGTQPGAAVSQQQPPMVMPGQSITPPTFSLTQDQREGIRQAANGSAYQPPVAYTPGTITPPPVQAPPPPTNALTEYVFALKDPATKAALIAEMAQQGQAPQSRYTDFNRLISFNLTPDQYSRYSADPRFSSVDIPFENRSDWVIGPFDPPAPGTITPPTVDQVQRAIQQPVTQPTLPPPPPPSPPLPPLPPPVAQTPPPPIAQIPPPTRRQNALQARLAQQQTTRPITPTPKPAPRPTVGSRAPSIPKPATRPAAVPARKISTQPVLRRGK